MQGSMRIWLLLILVAGSWTSCSKSNFIDPDLVQSGISYYPISTNLFIDTTNGEYINGSIFPAGDSLTFEVDYLSQDMVKVVNLYAGPNGGNDTLVNSVPSDSTYFSPFKGMDTLFLRYIIPDSAQSGASIQLRVQIQNSNSLSFTRTVFFQVQ